MVNLAGVLIAVGSFLLYCHLQKGYVGVRPYLLQLGCSLPMIGGALIALYG